MSHHTLWLIFAQNLKKKKDNSIVALGNKKKWGNRKYFFSVIFSSEFNLIQFNKWIED